MQKIFLSLFLLLMLCAAAQRPQVENLVFEGAGIRGVAYAGVLQALEQEGVLAGVKRVGGTSAGAITALLVSLSYSPAEIGSIIGSTNFRKFNDGGFFFPGGMVRLRQYLGWYKGRRFESWLDELIRKKTGSHSLTFAQLKALGYKDLYVTGTNLSAQRAVVFSQETFPNMQVRDAVRISASIPLYFEPLWMDESGAIVRRPKNKQGLAPMVDGGFITNFPIHLFDSTRYQQTALQNSPNMHTLGFRVDHEAQTNWDAAGRGLAPYPVKNLRSFVGAFYTLVIESLNRRQLSPSDWQRTVSINDGGVGPRIRRLNAAEINTLVANGRKATLQFLQLGEPRRR